jgi:glucan phosphoethanolaminetransferase (alkaline phosphatase superfamily)
MSDVRPARIAGRVAIEAAAWYGMAGVFLAFYIGLVAAPSTSIAAHLHLLTDCLLVLACVRIALCAIGVPRPLFRLLSAAIVALPFTALALYYGLVIVGVRSWGRVITWDMVASYLPQAPLLMEASGLSFPLVMAGLALAAAALIGIAWIFIGRLDWVPLLVARMSRSTLALATIGVFLAATVDIHEELVLPPFAAQEPFSLTLFPASASTRLQTHGMDRAAALRRDAIEQTARASYRPDPNAAHRNVILIVSDALRADHLPIYGYARDTTPNLSKLAATGVLRHSQPVHSVCSESVCGLLGLAGSRYVHQFSNRMVVLQEVLSKHGYRTAMIMGGDHTHFYGLRDFYGKVDSYFDGSMAAAGRYSNDDRVVLEQVAAMPKFDGKPLMLQVHLMSTHLLSRREDQFAVFQPSGSYFFMGNRTLGADGKTYEKPVNYYDNGVRQFDFMVTQIIESLRKNGYLENAVVAITGDHGESLGDHGNWTHQNSLYEEELRVPFLVASFGYRPERPLDKHPFPSQVDIAPTILEELGMPRPSSWTGLPMQGEAQHEVVYFEQGALIGFLDPRDPKKPWKYFEDGRAKKVYAFDLAADPKETRNLFDEVPSAMKQDWWLKTVPIKAQYTDTHMWNDLNYRYYSTYKSVNSGTPGVTE